MTVYAHLDHHQSRALRLVDPGTVAVFPWGRGSGKTFFGCTLLYRFLFENPGIEVGLLLPTLKRAKQVYWTRLSSDFAGGLRPYVRKLNSSDLEVHFRNGSRLTTWGAENADAIRGQRFGALVEDECDEIDISVEHAVVEPTFSKSGSRAYWSKFGTPKRGRQGILYRDFRRAQEAKVVEGRRYVGFRLRSADSPQVDQAWLRGVKATTPGKIYAREYECDFDSAEGLVYGEVFDESFHVRPPPAGARWDEILIGGDYGHEDAGVLLLIGILGRGRDATAYVLDEVYTPHRLESWWLDKMRLWLGWYPTARVYHDPSAAGRIEAYRRLCHARIQDVDNSIEDGVATVADRLFIRDLGEGQRAARLYIAPGCKNTIREFGAYRRKKDARSSAEDPVFTDDFQPGNDHAMDSLRYAIHNFFGGPDRRRAGVPDEALG